MEKTNTLIIVLSVIIGSIIIGGSIIYSFNNNADNTAVVSADTLNTDTEESPNAIEKNGEKFVIQKDDPTVHPDLNEDVTREVTVRTNDPNNPELSLKIDVLQTPK